MVASFPEFDYKKHKSQSKRKEICVPYGHNKPLIKNTQRPAAYNRCKEGAAADSTILGKILSFHGSFSRSYSSRPGKEEDPNEERPYKAQNSLLGDTARKFLSKKNSASLHVGDRPFLTDVHINTGKNKGSDVGKSRDSASKTRRKWSSIKGARLQSSSEGTKSGTCINGELVCQGRWEFSSDQRTAEDGAYTGSTKSSAVSDSVVLSAHEDESGVRIQYEAGNPAFTVKRNCSFHNLDAQEGKLGAQECTKNCGEGATHVARSVRLQHVEGNDVANSSDGVRGQATCENSRKASSSATGLPNFGSENLLYASDNSSNNMRWSSTSCASTDTSSSNSTRRSSCESRIHIVPTSVPFSSQAKPHKAHDATWAAIHNLQLHNGGAPLSIGHFKLIRRVGHGDIGSVFLAHLKQKVVASPSDVSCLFAIKVMDKDALAHRNKLQRMDMEKDILEAVDHPFLPTLYAHFNSEHFSCLVMDFCPGGDLYALRQKQPGKRFDILAARFYAAEVLLALEYLHMLGIVYRDLKPENVLVKEDGHIMLTDFDLSLKCDVQPQLLKHSLLSSSSLLMSSLSASSSSKKRLMRSCSQSSTISSSSAMSMSLLHQESTNCRLPVACSVDPIVSCLSFANDNSKKAQHIQKEQAAMASLSIAGSKSSVPHCASESPASRYKDRSVIEPPQLSKQEVHCASLPILMEKASDGEAAGRSRMSSRHVENYKNKTEHSCEGIERTSTSGLICSEENMVLMELVAEPTQARSMSFVGTHEYLAPEIIAGHGHGSPVDWWTLGIFLYELLFGRTPFKGVSNDQTLINIIRQQLKFPHDMSDDDEFENARSLMEGLLMKDPRKRLGCIKGAAEIKQHAFFKGVNWALIRCMQPPEMPGSISKRHANMSSSYHQIHRHNHRPASKSLHHFDLF